MESGKFSPTLLALFAAIAQAGPVSAQGMPAAPAPGNLGPLFNARAMEIKSAKPGDQDVVRATDVLTERLKRNPRIFQTTVVAPCPQAPPPDPSGDGKPRSDFITIEQYKGKVSPSVDEETDFLKASPTLSTSEKRALTGYVAPQFKSFGDRTKLTTVGGGCPSPGPAPSGDSGLTSGNKP